MQEMKEQIAASVRQIDELNRELAEHWTKIQKCVFEQRVDEAVSLLNAYFRIRTTLEGVEARLRGTLSGFFADK